MVKCAYCGKEVSMPFVCPYCGQTFCAEHRLPENHECPNMPKEPFWYQKRKSIEVKTKSEMLSEGELYFIKKPKKSMEDFLVSSKPSKVRIRLQTLLSKMFFLGMMIAVAFIYVPAMEWATSLNVGEGIIAYLPWAFVLAMCHELLHAIAWWSFGYSAIPIPVLIPPILGITIGDKPKRRRENFVISTAPVLLTISSLLVYYLTGNQQYLLFGILNISGMFYDFASIFL